MARHNPFRIFRKNQTAWLAGLTLFTMFSFIALGSMFQCLQVGSRTGQAGVFAKTKTFGNYDYSAMLVQQDEVNRLYTFLQTAASSMAQDDLLAMQGNLIFSFEGPADKPEERMPVVLDQLMLLLGELSNTLNGENSENLVNRWLVIQTGRKEGLAPTENNVRDYLTALFNGKLNSKHLSQGLASAGLRQDGLVLRDDEVELRRAPAHDLRVHLVARLRESVALLLRVARRVDLLVGADRPGRDVRVDRVRIAVEDLADLLARERRDAARRQAGVRRALRG